MPIYIAFILGVILALGATIVAFILILPDKKRPKLNKFFTWIHDFFNFKSLWLEKIIKFLYVFSTLSCIGVGFFMLFSGYESYSYSYFSKYSSSSFQSYAGYGVLVILLGPVILRIFYEFIMLTILLVKNAMDINNKLTPQEGSVADKKFKEEQRKAEEAAARAQYQQQQQYAQQQYAQQQYAQQYQQQYQQQYVQPPYDQPAPNQDPNNQ